MLAILTLFPVSAWTAEPENEGRIDLLTVYQQALANNTAYRASLATLEGQKYEWDKSRAQLMPSISLSGSVNKYQYESLSEFTTTEVVNTPPADSDQTGDNSTGNQTNKPQVIHGTKIQKNTYDYKQRYYGLGLRQPLYRPQTWIQYQKSQQIFYRAIASIEKERQNLAARVAQAYFDVLLSQDQLVMIRAQLAAYELRLKQAQRGLTAGTSTKTDLYDVQAQRDITAAQEEEVRNNLALSFQTLSTLTTLPIDQIRALDPGQLPTDPVAGRKIDEWASQATTIHPELDRLRYEVVAAEHDLSSAKAGHYPVLDLVARRQVSTNYGDLQDIQGVGKGSSTTSVGLEASLPIFSGGYVNATIDQARLNLDRSREQLDASLREILIRVRQEYDRLIQGQKKIKAYQQAEASSELAAKATEKGIQAGTRTMVDSLLTQQNLYATRRNLAQARYDFVKSYVNLRLHAGELTEELMQQVNSWLK
ncbi:MAG: TolC family outer membrane protein [Magnetococcales bacterium]|nr:TolC family outer membrane protein [Magnetococcales bacterium]